MKKSIDILVSALAFFCSRDRKFIIPLVIIFAKFIASYLLAICILIG